MGGAQVEQRPAIHVRPAHPQEGERLREIAIAAKSYWGYEPGSVETWAAMGDFSAQALADKAVHVAEVDGRPVAFATLIPKGEISVLDDLWVEPQWIGQGIGAWLFRFCAEEARRLGAKRMEWEAEPNAVGFYERMGAQRLRDSERTMWGRVIPVLGTDLAAPPPRRRVNPPATV